MKTRRPWTQQNQRSGNKLCLEERQQDEGVGMCVCVCIGMCRGGRDKSRMESQATESYLLVGKLRKAVELAESHQTQKQGARDEGRGWMTRVGDDRIPFSMRDFLRAYFQRK